MLINNPGSIAYDVFLSSGFSMAVHCHCSHGGGGTDAWGRGKTDAIDLHTCNFNVGSFSCITFKTISQEWNFNPADLLFYILPSSHCVVRYIIALHSSLLQNLKKKLFSESSSLNVKKCSAARPGRCHWKSLQHHRSWKLKDVGEEALL